MRTCREVFELYYQYYHALGWRRTAIDLLYSAVRRHVFFWCPYSSNEEFFCAQCGRPVLRRVLFCSSECGRKFDDDVKEME
jgi:hypothetical protein